MSAAVAEVNGVDELKLHKPDEEQEQAEGEQSPEVDAESPPANSDPEPIVEGEAVPEELGGEAKLFPEPEEPSPPTPTAQDPSDLYANFYAELREKQAKVDQLNSRAAQLKTESKYAADTAKNAEAEMQALVRRGPVLFAEHKAEEDDNEDEEGEEVGDSSRTDQPATTEAVVEVEDESWKGTPLTELSIPSKLLDHLAEGRLTTLGELATFTSDPFNKLTDLKGIGEKAAEKVDAALEKFWQQRKSDQSI